MKKEKRNIKRKEENIINHKRDILNKKKIILFVASLILICITLFLLNRTITTGNAISIDSEESVDPLGIGFNPENIPETPEEAREKARDFLKKEWGVILRDENTKFGKFTAPILKGYDKIAVYTNPIFKIILGIEPSLTWLFILTLVIWITLITNLYTILSTFSLFSKTASLVISLGSVIIVSILGLPKFFAAKILAIVGTLTIWWMQLIVALLIIISLILISTFRQEWEALKLALEEMKEKNDLKKKVEGLESKEEKHESFEKSISDSFNNI